MQKIEKFKKLITAESIQIWSAFVSAVDLLIRRKFSSFAHQKVHRHLLCKLENCFTKYKLRNTNPTLSWYWHLLSAPLVLSALHSWKYDGRWETGECPSSLMAGMGVDKWVCDVKRTHSRQIRFYPSNILVCFIAIVSIECRLDPPLLPYFNLGHTLPQSVKNLWHLFKESWKLNSKLKRNFKF